MPGTADMQQQHRHQLNANSNRRTSSSRNNSNGRDSKYTLATSGSTAAAKTTRSSLIIDISDVAVVVMLATSRKLVTSRLERAEGQQQLNPGTPKFFAGFFTQKTFNW
jgi:hypothetical protein